MRLAAGFFALLLFVSCGSDEAPIGPLEGTVTNLIIEDGTVTSFDLVTDDRIVPIVVDEDRDYGFDPLHLEEHQSTGDPVIVETETEDGEQVATSIEDV